MNDQAEFELRGNEICSIKSGKVVATINSTGDVVMTQGYNGMSKKVHAFYDALPQMPPASVGADGTADDTDGGLPADDLEDPELQPVDPVGTLPVDTLPVDPVDSPAEALAMMSPEELNSTTVFVGNVPNEAVCSKKAAPAADIPEGCDEMLIYSIPADELPELDVNFGTNTKEFKMFVKLHKLTGNQITILCRRIERKMRGF